MKDDGKENICCLETDVLVQLTLQSRGLRPSPFGREDLLRAREVRLGVEHPEGLRLTTSTSQQAWSSFNALFPALITLDREGIAEHNKGR